MYIAVDIGGTKTLVAAYSEDGQILRSNKQPTDKKFDSFLKNLEAQVEKVASDDTIQAIGIAAPGLIDDETNIVKSFGNLDWENVDVVTPLKHAFTDQVFIENDAKMGALGEANMGAGEDYGTVLYITLSTGIGTGVTDAGKLVHSLRHMESGSMRLDEDSHKIWEKYASGKAFFEEFGMYGEDDENPEHWKKWAADVALGMYDLIAIVQPNVVVIGGSMGNHIHKYHEFLHKEIQSLRTNMVDMPIIVGAQNPDEAVINGCYVTCKQQSES